MAAALKQIHPCWHEDLLPGQWATFQGKHGLLHVGLCLIQPVTAQLILDHHNNRNRRAVRSAINYLTQDMAAGKYLESGETIIFDDQRELVNGQNRLTSCVNSGKAISQLVVVGVNPAVFQVIDQQARRSAGQVLQMLGEKSANTLAGALSYLNVLLVRGEVFQSKATVWSHPLTIHGRIELLVAHPDLRESLTTILGMRTSKNAKMLFPSHALAIALHYLFGAAKPSLNKRFWEAVMSLDLEKEDRFSSCRQLVKRLTNNLTDQAKLPVRVVAALTIKAWSSFVKSEKMDLLQFKEGQNEKFPKIEGLKYRSDGSMEL